jgi:hypothetical protein
MLKGFLFFVIVFSVLATNKFSHFPVKSVKAGSLYQIDLSLNQRGQVFLHYKTNVSDRFRVIEMKNSALNHSAGIEIPKENATELIYYFSVYDAFGHASTYPQVDPELNAFTSRVVVYKQEINLNYEIISPYKGETVYADEFTLALALFDVSGRIDVKNSKVYIDGIDRTRFAVLTDELITMIPNKDLSEGQHLLRVELYDKSKSLLKTISWHAYVESVEENENSLHTAFGGTASYDLSSEVFQEFDDATSKYNEISENFQNVNLNVRAELGDLRLSAHGKLSSEQSADRQNINRFSLNADWQFIRAGFGDVTPDYHPFLLQNQNIRGFDAGIYTNWVNFEATYGTTNRQIHVRPEENVLGAFERKSFAGRLSFGKRYKSQFGLTFFWSQDQDIANSDSLIQLNPEENIGLGLDYKLTFFDDNLQFYFGGAGTAYNENIRGGSIAYKHFKARYGSGVSESNYNLFTEIITINNLPIVDYMYFADVQWNTSINYLKTSYELVRENYLSHGQPFINTGIRKFSLFDRLRLFSSQLYITLEASIQRDNINENKETETNTIKNFNYGLTYYPYSEYLPSINAKLGQISQSSAGTTNTVNFDITQSLTFMGVKNDFVVSFTNSETDNFMIITERVIENSIQADTLNILGADGRQIFASVTTEIGSALRTFVQFSTSNDGNGSDDYKSSDLAFRGEYDFASLFGEEETSFRTFGQVNFGSNRRTEFDANSQKVFDENLGEKAIELGVTYYMPFGQTQSLNANFSLKTISYTGSENGDFSNRYVSLSAEYSF